MILTSVTAQKKNKVSIKDFFSKCDQTRSFLQICSNLLKKSLMESFIFWAVRLSDSVSVWINWLGKLGVMKWNIKMVHYDVVWWKSSGNSPSLGPNKEWEIFNLEIVVQQLIYGVGEGQIQGRFWFDVIKLISSCWFNFV